MIPLSSSAEAATLHLPAGSRASSAVAASAPKARCGSRAFRPDPLTPQQVAQLLAAAFPLDPGSWGRTAPSAHQWQEITLYAVTPQGAWRHGPRMHALHPVGGQDLRTAAGALGSVLAAPLHLVYVSDCDGLQQAHAEEHGLLAGADAGAIVEKIHACCADLGLADLVRGTLDRPLLARALGLGATQHIALVQAVGYPVAERH